MSIDLDDVQPYNAVFWYEFLNVTVNFRIKLYEKNP